MSSRLEPWKTRAAEARERGQRTLVWGIWERMLESEFIDRSVALAAKGFVAFFPLIIVVAAFLPDGARSSLLRTIITKLGMSGPALASARKAFADAGDVRRATGFLGLIYTFFYAHSFTTALQRVYARAWRRPASGKVTSYLRGPAWLLAVLVYAGVLGMIRGALGGSPAAAVAFIVVNLVAATGLWWLTSWFMLQGQVRMRALIATGAITGLAFTVYAATASLWMPGAVEGREHQFGFFGVALALVTWFTGAGICIVVGACAGSVLAQDSGVVGRWARGPEVEALAPGAAPPLPPPITAPHLKDALGLHPDDQPDAEGP